MSRPRSIRVLHLLAAPYPTLQGSQVLVGGMVRALASRGHEVTLLCYGHAMGLARASDGGVRIQRTRRIPGYARLRAGPDPIKPVLDLSLAARACALAGSVDLVHAHNYEAPLAAYLARHLRGVPVVYHGHNTMAEELPTYFGARSTRRLASSLGRALDRWVPHRAELALGISESGCAALERLGCPDVRLLRPAVELRDLEGAQPDRARARHGLGESPWVVYAGNVDRYQDLDLLLAAMARLPQVGLLLASPNDLRGLARRCDRFGVGPQRRRLVRVACWAESRDLIAAADVAASPRTVCSGFPIKLLNYLGLGIPAVASAGASAPIDGVVTVHDAEPAGMAAAIAYLLDHPEQRRGLGAMAQVAVQAGWSWRQRVIELEAGYRELLERERPRAVLPSA